MKTYLEWNQQTNFKASELSIPSCISLSHIFFFESLWSQWTVCYKILPPIDIEHCHCIATERLLSCTLMDLGEAMDTLDTFIDYFFSFSFNKTDKIDIPNDVFSTVFVLFSFTNDIKTFNIFHGEPQSSKGNILNIHSMVLAQSETFPRKCRN